MSETPKFPSVGPKIINELRDVLSRRHALFFLLAIGLVISIPDTDESDTPSEGAFGVDVTNVYGGMTALPSRYSFCNPDVRGENGVSKLTQITESNETCTSLSECNSEGADPINCEVAIANAGFSSANGISAASHTVATLLYGHEDEEGNGEGNEPSRKSISELVSFNDLPPLYKNILIRFNPQKTHLLEKAYFQFNMQSPVFKGAFVPINVDEDSYNACDNEQG